MRCPNQHEQTPPHQLSEIEKQKKTDRNSEIKTKQKADPHQNSHELNMFAPHFPTQNRKT